MWKRFIAYYKPFKLMFTLDMGASLLISVIGLITTRRQREPARPTN